MRAASSRERVKISAAAVTATNPIRTISITKSVQYFIHKNDPEKYQYKKDGIIDYCFGVEEYFINAPTMVEKRLYLQEMVTWAKENKIIRMNQLIDEALKNHTDTWARVFEDSPRWTIERYINAQWQEKESEKKNHFTNDCPPADEI